MPHNRLYFLTIFQLFLLAVVALTACAPKRHTDTLAAPASLETATANSPSGGLPRADPAYIQWLERQSMLGAAPRLSAQVSGTQIIWHNSATAQRLPMLLDAAPNWFYLNPYTVKQPVFRSLATPEFTDFLLRTGFNGLFIAPAYERGDVWQKSEHGSSDGENATSLKFDSVLGDSANFDNLAEHMDNARIQMGGNLPAAATGLGPDFMLQARYAPRFNGIYAMISVPQNAWDMLPQTTDEWECLPLLPEVTAQLAQRGLLPESLGRDALPWATPGGWAVTGEVRGTDGQMRRWIYRYNQDVLRPVLLWQDPSAQTKRIFSAAVIQHTGLQRQTLAGVKLEALMGLDVITRDTPRTGNPALNALTPGLEALDEIAREIHRYGGWALQADILPEDLTPAILSTAVDAARDSATPAAVAHALRTQDTLPLLKLLRKAIAAKTDQSRLARGLNEDKILSEARLLALGWRIGLPGLCFISSQDISHSSEQFFAEPASSDMLTSLARLLQHRKRADLARGKLLAVVSGPASCIAATSALPDGGFWLLVSNFSNKKQVISIALPAGFAADAAQDVLDGQIFDGRNFEIPLDARQTRHIVSVRPFYEGSRP
ncbi:MAG: hypothetical protein LBV65_01920 [Desulfovibrio sp.]|jgi:hypothetical protein|nr:hypothetical protein [Desulfovibrio sp.]